MAETKAGGAATTANARSSTMNHSGERWSIKGTLEGLWASGAGSIYTHEKAPNATSAVRAGNLDSQISEGVKFMGYGRGVHTERLGTEGHAAKTRKAGKVRIGGAEASEEMRDRSSLTKLGGFNPFRAPRSSDSDFGGDHTALPATCNLSWFTKNLKGVAKYGTMNSFGNMGISTRGRTEAGAGGNNTNASGERSRT